MTPKEYVVDWKEMNRWNIAKKQIPEYCHIINYSLYDQYKTFILIVVVLIVILISYLVFQSLRKERKLRRHEQLPRLYLANLLCRVMKYISSLYIKLTYIVYLNLKFVQEHG